MKIKTLIWAKCTGNSVTCVSPSAIGDYEINVIEDNTFCPMLMRNPLSTATYKNIDDAKNCAQMHFDNIVKACLENE